MTQVYKVIIGEPFEQWLNKFDIDKLPIIHKAKVEIANKIYKFILFTENFFNASGHGYAFINDTDMEVFSNIEDEDILKAYMYDILLDNLSKMDITSLDAFTETATNLFEENGIKDNVKALSKNMNVSNLPTDVTIKYVDDSRVVTDNPKIKFKDYSFDHLFLQKLFSFHFERNHIQYFKNNQNLKGAFTEHQVSFSHVDDLKKDGIYISPIQYESLTDSLDNKEQILLSGPTGSGKSTIVFYLVRKDSQEYVTIECNESKTYSDLFGSLTVTTSPAGENVLVPSLGKIAIAYRDGKRLVLEEFTALNDKCFKALLTMMQHDELNLEIDSEQENGEFVKNITIKRHPDFQIIATANEEKRYNVNSLTPQVKRRFHTIVPINYLPEAEEIEFISHRLESKRIGVNQEEIKLIVEIGNMLRAKKLVVSTATLAIWAEKSVRYGIRSASLCHFVPQVVFSQNDLKTVNDTMSVKIPNFEPIVLAL